MGSKEKEHKRTFSLPGRSGGAKEKGKEAGQRKGDKAGNKDTINHTESGEETCVVSYPR